MAKSLRVLLAAGLLSVTWYGTAAAQDKIMLRFSAASPPSDFLSKSMEVFKTELDKAAPNQFDVRLHPGSTLFRQGTEVPAIQRGNLEMSYMQTFEVSQQIPELGILNRAYLFRDYAHMAAVMRGPIGAEVAKKILDKMQIVVLDVTYLGTRQVNLRVVRDVKGPTDLAGVKLRMPASPEWLLLGQTLGVTPTPMAMAETYTALQTGAVDGQENPLTIGFAAKFHEVTKQVVLTSHLVQPVFTALGKQAWDKMSDAQKKHATAAAKAAAKYNDDARLEDEKQVAEKYKAAGLTISPIDLAAFRANADKVYAASDLAKNWDKDLEKRILATK